MLGGIKGQLRENTVDFGQGVGWAIAIVDQSRQTLSQTALASSSVRNRVMGSTVMSGAPRSKSSAGSDSVNHRISGAPSSSGSVNRFMQPAICLSRVPI